MIADTFQYPQLLHLLWLLIPISILLFFRLWKRSSFLRYNAIFSSPKTWRHLLIVIPPLAYCFSFVCLVLALARPIGVDESIKTISKEGIDIILTMDISSSMRALDLKPNRLEASKQIAMDFVKGRTNDRVGVVIYAAESFTQSPLTSDYAVVNTVLKEIKFDMLEDGTAIGLGLATAVSRIKDSESKSKVIILLTDGKNNSGSIDPNTAAALAKQFGVKVYTIGIGKKGLTPFPMKDAFGRTVVQNIEMEIDEEQLKSIASNSGGKYFRATDNTSLKSIYKAIEKLEKTEIKEIKYRNVDEKFRPYLLYALGTLLLGFLLETSVLKSAV